ncbi:sensor histidine kinase YesM [Clostridium aceticum]|uniref:Sensor histidine kinase YesM n=1 Tax=Clostridium aceticum TaxID=84022 RepID=A0A0G3W997_9CLOT|nr:histidine kinase [Clostridium aceticum]AKL95261.1 sensor histidine kinase YesM [Clostridium aceticum]
MRKSIKTKIIIAILIVFSILFSIYLYIIDGQVKENVTVLNRNLTKEIVDARAYQISYWLQQRKIELEMMSDCIISFGMDEVEARAYVGAVYKKKSNVYLDMGIVKFGGYKISNDGIREWISQEKYYRDALKENATFKVSGPVEKNGENTVAMLYKVGGVNREIEFIYAEISLENLMRIASRINVYDGIGEILISNNSIHTNDKIFYQDFMKESPIIFETDIGAARGWSLNYYIPKRNINEINHHIRKSILIFGSILLMTILALLIISYTSIVKPIDQLKKLMKKVEEGDLSVRLKSNRQDEIGSLITSFNNMTQKLENLSYQEKEMRLKIMQEQIKPHFLYNTLDTIKWVAMEENTEEVLSLIDALSTYFRIGLSNGKTFITLDEELEHIDSYLNIQKTRYENRLTYSIHYEDALLDYRVMRVLLQPIVENAVVHGVNNRESGGKISIFITQDDSAILIKIMNNSEMPLDRLAVINHALKLDRPTETVKGYGLYSVNHRIKLEHGEEYGLELQSQKGWTTATIRIPKIRGEGKNV